MSKMTGIVERFNRNDNGFTSLKINGKWVSTYRDDHSDKEGKTVEVEVTEVNKNGRTYLNGKNVNVVTLAPNIAPPLPMAPDARQQSIVMQSSFRTAAEILGTMVAADALMLGNKKGEKFDILMGIHEQIALRLYAGAMDPTSLLTEEEDPEAPPSDDWDPMEA